MEFALARNWWSLVIRGLVAILVGIVTFAWPGISLLAWAMLFGAYALIDGIVNIAGAVRAVRANERWGALVLEGAVGIIAAVITLLWPTITVLALVYVIAVWALVTGILEIAAAVRLRHYIQREWLLVLGGIASIVFGILMAFAPMTGAFVLALWLGAYCFVFGSLLVVLGFRLRNWRSTFLSGPAVPLPAH